MCCRLTITPFDETIARTILAIGLFVPETVTVGHPEFRRRIEEEKTTVIAELKPADDFTPAHLKLSLSPSVSQYAHHADKRIAGSVMFEIAAKYAEAVEGTIIQQANVTGCVEAGAPNNRVLAQYPESPMLWEKVCLGFQETILGDPGRSVDG